MKKLLTFLVLVGLLLSLQVSFVSAQEPADTPEPTTYVVEEEDTAESIAELFGVSVEDLLAANELSSADEIEVDMVLVIPEPADEPVDEPPADEPVDEPPADEPPAGEERPPEKQPPAEQPPEQPPTDTDEERPSDEQPTDEQLPEQPPTDTDEERPSEQQPAEQPPEQPLADERPAEEPPADEPPVSERTGEGTEAPASEGDVGPAAALPGTFTSQIIAIANLLDSGAAETPVLTLYNIDSSSDTVVSSMPSVYPGGVGFVTDNQIPTGRHAGVIESSFPAAAAVLTVNSSARTADAYAGINVPSTELFATLIFNKHSNWESTLICQNTGATANITAQLYKAGDTSARVTLTANSVETNNSVVWDIADNSAVQSAWPGGNGEFGFARFSSSSEIACVVDNQRMASPHVQSQYGAVPPSFAGNEMYSPLVFHGHGQSSENEKEVKWNSGVSFVNTSGSSANVTVIYSADNGYRATCTRTIPGNGSANWYMPSVQALGWSCAPNSSLPWSYPGGPTFGSIEVSSSQPVLALNNSNRYDGSTLGAGFSSALAGPDVATGLVACPLAFNKSAASDWVSGVRVVNVGNVTTNVTWTMVRANVNPGGSGNRVTITQSNVAPGEGASAFFPEQGSALTSFEGAVFVEASNSSALIAATSNSTNYNALGAGAQYECFNY